MRASRNFIGINESTGERRTFNSCYIFAKEFSVNPATVVNVLKANGTIKGWRLYDTPDNIRKRIEDFEAQIRMLEG